MSQLRISNTSEEKSLVYVALFHPDLRFIPDNTLLGQLNDTCVTHGAISSQRFLCCFQKSNGGESLEEQTRLHRVRAKVVAEAVSFRNQVIENQTRTAIGQFYQEK